MRSQITLTLFAAMLSFFTMSCDKDDDYDRQNENTVKVSTTLQNGTWRITRYKNDGIDRSSLFSEYVFQFNTGNVLQATQGANVYTGSWSVTADNDRSTDLDLNIFFSNSADLRLINEDWDVINYTDNRLEVADDYGDIDEDLIVFEKQ